MFSGNQAASLRMHPKEGVKNHGNTSSRARSLTVARCFTISLKDTRTLQITRPTLAPYYFTLHCTLIKYHYINAIVGTGTNFYKLIFIQLLVVMFQVIRAIKYDRTANERNAIRENSAIFTSSRRGGYFKLCFFLLLSFVLP